MQSTRKYTVLNNNQNNNEQNQETLLFVRVFNPGA